MSETLWSIVTQADGSKQVTVSYKPMKIHWTVIASLVIGLLIIGLGLAQLPMVASELAGSDVRLARQIAVVFCLVVGGLIVALSFFLAITEMLTVQRENIRRIVDGYGSAKQ